MQRLHSPEKVYKHEFPLHQDQTQLLKMRHHNFARLNSINVLGFHTAFIQDNLLPPDQNYTIKIGIFDVISGIYLPNLKCTQSNNTCCYYHVIAVLRYVEIAENVVENSPIFHCGCMCSL